MKKIVILLTILIVITGCNKTKDKKFYLDDKYYNNGSFIEITEEELNNLQDSESSYLIYTYNSYCTFKIPCDTIFEEIMKKYNIDVYSMPHELMRKTFIHDTIKYSPTLAVINKGKIVAYLNAESDDDLSKYQDAKEFEKWLDKYIYLEK